MGRQFISIGGKMFCEKKKKKRKESLWLPFKFKVPMK